MNTQKGFSTILVVIIGLLVIVGGTYIYLNTKNDNGGGVAVEYFDQPDSYDSSAKEDTQHTKTQYDFVYTMEEFTQGVYGSNYSLKDGVLVKLGEVPKKLYIYNAETGISREISFEETQKYYIDPERSSPEGYVFDYIDEDNGYFISNGSSKNKIDVVENEYVKAPGYSSRAVWFIGWVR